MTRDLLVGALVLRVPRSIRPAVVYESHGLATVFAERRADMLSNGISASGAKLRRLHSRERRVWRRAEGYVTITAALQSDLTSALRAAAERRDHS